MQRLLRAILILGAILMHQYGHSQCPNVVWSDEFSGTSLDQSKWNYQTGTGCDIGICGWGNNELQYYQEDQVSVNNGTLKITAAKENYRGSKYTSGRINTKGKGDFTYGEVSNTGRYEARIKLPAGMGLWPAFWMLSTNEPYGGWPQSGELDIMEFVGARPDEILGTIHYGDPYPNNQFQGNSYFIDGAYPDAFHEFAVEWEPGEIRWFMDGILFSTKTPADVAPYNWPFDQDFHFLLNVAVGGNLGGPVDDAIFPATMEVDYVRVLDGFKPYIAGDPVVENQASGVVYTIGNTGGGTSINWSVPSGATIVSGQGTSEVTVDFGSASGPVSATINDGCTVYDLAIAVEVEPAFVYEFSFENFDDPATATYTFSTGTLNEVSNPAANAVNGSALSGQYTRNSAEQYDVLVYSVTNITDGSQYSEKQKKFYADVYTDAPVGTEILLQLETSTATSTNYPTGRHSRYVATITETNNWHRLAFDLLDRPDQGAADNDIISMILLFDSNSFTGDTYYFDNLDSYTADGGGANIPPTVSITAPADGSGYDQGASITIEATASDADGTVSQVTFLADGNAIGTDNSAPYSINWTVPLGTTTLTAVATDNENASTTSAGVSVTGNATGSATHVEVSSVVTGTISAGQGNKYGSATVTVVDNLGNPVGGALVSGTFSGTYNESASGTTNAQGVTVIQTTATAKGGVTVNFCVDDVSASGLIYDAGQDPYHCSGARVRGLEINTERPAGLKVFPNPVGNRLRWTLGGFGESVDLRILDQHGKQLLQLDGSRLSADISKLAPGVYYLLAEGGQRREQIRFTKGR
ncbi:Ig-like domain-containing protein [Flavilitoribacter nigricans]|uniref:GH16 domain-containing protein n=1 Tax=Flavilitoribacter nigricans (strain ATCC 23147 / DSM 23189 / NBRC 102662 / NCIMB 1420 / SS-2) TaxID=1122177 RepID=A0A2D0NHZ5_FLAN2|nr:family 16 glycosylhydrolase [Flavilitoribacter nigricans]PHN08101.1 hypothetical protein CRP01_01915 [Flavilitoribacter nigricans DSM 23189 = NBRC 102662]